MHHLVVFLCILINQLSFPYSNNEVKEKAQDCLNKTKEMQGKMEEIKKINKDAREEQINKETYKDCLAHLEDKEIPIRGHGLIALTALITKRDEETMTHIEDVFKIFTDNLSDEDTYIYLQAIKVTKQGRYSMRGRGG